MDPNRYSIFPRMTMSATSLPALSNPSTIKLHSRRSPTTFLRRASSLRQRFLPHPSTARCSSKKDQTSFTDRILDYIEGGPKLRKWYGAPDLLPTDGGLDDDDNQEDVSPDKEEERDAVFVTNGDSEIGQMVILALILKRVRVKALVKNKRAIFDAFGTYVEPVTGDAKAKSFLAKSLRGVRAIICPSWEGFLSDAGQMKGIEHTVVLSQLDAYRGSSGLQALLTSNARKLSERDEEAVTASGIPYTIIKAGLLHDSPGGNQGFSFKEGIASKGKLCKEDAARICAEALDVVPQRGIVLEVANGEEKVLDWKEVFTSRNKSEEPSQ